MSQCALLTTLNCVSPNLSSLSGTLFNLFMAYPKHLPYYCYVVMAVLKCHKIYDACRYFGRRIVSLITGVRVFSCLRVVLRGRMTKVVRPPRLQCREEARSRRDADSALPYCLTCVGGSHNAKGVNTRYVAN